MIKTQNLGKKYKLPLREEFWALQGIDLEISPGEIVGLIGPNGSGKSTLLKILARVTWPSTGRLELSGRVGALLEVGTGFHTELTGRENIFLSGAILGMRRSEVKHHFDEIIAFSGVEDFLDIPVKKYSSGMFLRLAFSVMAHLKSEILIIDEIIAVGDQSFQEKCLQKIQSLADEGRTVILVSHQLDNIRTLCSRVLWLDHGRCIADGEPQPILEHYECKAALHPVEN
ncbi:MAG: Teichoic acids export ATP-binding protein TagH [Chlamydiae bacterium]|nr:Teichoic acids export ATP-binding protein TagH [Chlamydiota bacterium]